MPRNLDEVLSWEEERVVQRDWTVACEGKWYQLDRQHEALSLVGRKVVVRTLRDGRVQLVYRGRKLKWRGLPGRPGVRKPAPVKPVKKRGQLKPPAANIRGGGWAWVWGGSFGEELKAQRAARGAAGGGGTPVGLRYAPASLRPATPTGEQTPTTTKRGHSLLS